MTTGLLPRDHLDISKLPRTRFQTTKHFIIQFHISCYSYTLTKATNEKTATHTFLSFYSRISLLRRVDLCTPKPSIEIHTTKMFTMIPYIMLFVLFHRPMTVNESQRKYYFSMTSLLPRVDFQTPKSFAHNSN